MVSIIGRRNSRFGTGRVMSQIRMQALLLPRASSAQRRARRSGWSKRVGGWRRVGSGSFGSTALRMTVGSAPAGSVRRQRAAAVGDLDVFVCHEFLGA